MGNTVSSNVYLEDIRHFQAFAEARREVFKSDFPTSPAVHVASGLLLK